MQRRRMVQSRQISAGLAALAILALAPRARADETGSPGAVHGSTETGNLSLAEQGVALYKAHEYRRAAEKFLQAYATDQDPNLLFNIARCYEALGDSPGAIEKYEAFLRIPDIDPKGRERAQTALRALHAGKPAKAPGSARAPERVPEATTRPQPEPPPTPATPVGHGDARAVVGWIVAGALAAGTAVTGVLAVTTAGQLRDARAIYPGDRSNIDQLSSRTLALSITADALGAATLIASGLSLYWTVSGPSSRSEVKAQLAPTGFAVTGTF